MLYICVTKLITMNYTTQQIETAKYNYNQFLAFKTVSEYLQGMEDVREAERRCEYHNNIVSSIRNGNKELEREWKMFFLNEVIRAEQHRRESDAKLKANKEASQSILEPIKKMRKLGEYGAWLNTKGNKFRKEHFSKKYTQESVNEFINSLTK